MSGDGRDEAKTARLSPEPCEAFRKLGVARGALAFYADPLEWGPDGDAVEDAGKNARAAFDATHMQHTACRSDATPDAGRSEARPAGELGDFARWIVSEMRHSAREVWDHACATCIPGGPIVIPGFVCVPHRAEALIAAGRLDATPRNDSTVAQAVKPSWLTGEPEDLRRVAKEWCRDGGIDNPALIHELHQLLEETRTIDRERRNEAKREPGVPSPTDADRRRARTWWNEQDYRDTPEKSVESLATLIAAVRIETERNAGRSKATPDEEDPYAALAAMQYTVRLLARRKEKRSKEIGLSLAWLLGCIEGGHDIDALSRPDAPPEGEMSDDEAAQRVYDRLQAARKT